MSNVFVGFHDRKSCSRILKPPGGGTSDIFGTEETARKAKLARERAAEKDPVDVVEEKKDLAEVVVDEEEEEEKKTKEEVDLGDVVVEEKTKIIDTLSSVVHHSEHKESQTGPQRRTGHRVPPGGYSSGLW